MATAISEFEAEALPELEAQTHEIGGEREFYRALSRLGRHGALPARTVGSAAGRAVLSLVRDADGLSVRPACACQEGAHQFEEEINPIRKIYPDAMMEHLGHAAAEAQTEAEAQALAGALVPLVARVVPRAAPAIMRAAPGLACGVARVIRTLHRSPATRPLVRTVPAIVRSTAASVARQAVRGVTVSPQTVVRTLARQANRVLASPSHAAQVFRRSQQLDRQFHRAAGRAGELCSACRRCGAATSIQR